MVEISDGEDRIKDGNIRERILGQWRLRHMEANRFYVFSLLIHSYFYSVTWCF